MVANTTGPNNPLFGIDLGSDNGYANEPFFIGGETAYPVGDVYFEYTMPSGLGGARLEYCLFSNGFAAPNVGDSITIANTRWINLTAAGIVNP